MVKVKLLAAPEDAVALGAKGLAGGEKADGELVGTCSLLFSGDIVQPQLAEGIDDRLTARQGIPQDA